MDLKKIIDGFSDAQLHLLTEYLTAETAKQVVAAGDTVLDLGANVGYHTNLFSELVGEAGKVQAFEPNPALWPLLHRWPNVRLWPVAVGAELGLATLHVPVGPRLDQVASLVETAMFGATEPHTVPVVAIDLLPEIVTASFVKIDVERYELQALKGMMGLIERCAPVIVYEGHTSEIVNLLSSAGYVMHQLAGDLYASDRCPVSNWVACRPEHRDRALLPAKLIADMVDGLVEREPPSRLSRWRSALTGRGST